MWRVAAKVVTVDENLARAKILAPLSRQNGDTDTHASQLRRIDDGDDADADADLLPLRLLMRCAPPTRRCTLVIGLTKDASHMQQWRPRRCLPRLLVPAAAFAAAIAEFDVVAFCSYLDIVNSDTAF